MQRWKAIATASAAVVGVAALGGILRLDRPADQELELVAAGDAGQYAFTVQATGVDELYPGAVRRLHLTLRNPYPFDLRITDVRAEVVSTSRPGCTPSPANLEVHAYTGSVPVRVAAKGSVQGGTVPLHMPNSVANDCQRATFIIGLHADAIRADQ